MAQRTVMRMSLAQMRAMANEENPSPSTTAAPAQPSNSIYIVTEHTTKANGQGHVYANAFGPSRSIQDTLTAILARYPHASGLIQPGQATPFTHIKWEEGNGDEVLVELVEEESNAAVYASPDDQDLFSIIHRVANFDDRPFSERASMEGTYLTRAAANEAGLRIFRKAIEGKDLGGKREETEPDGTLFCAAHSAGEGGYRWTVDVHRCTWEFLAYREEEEANV